MTKTHGCLVLHQVQSKEIKVSVPLYDAKVSAGFPSPADDYVGDKIDLNEQLISSPAATFCVRVTGNSMINAQIREGDILIVDRSIEPKHGKIIIAIVDGDLTVKRLFRQQEEIVLISENDEYPNLKITNQDLDVWGVVTYIIHKV